MRVSTLTLPERYVYTINRRRADRVIWVGLGRRPKPKSDMPTIVIEFVSPGKANWKRDSIEKRREYLAAGVIESWIINRFLRTLTVVRMTPHGDCREHRRRGRNIPHRASPRFRVVPGLALGRGRSREGCRRMRTVEMRISHPSGRFGKGIRDSRLRGERIFQATRLVFPLESRIKSGKTPPLTIRVLSKDRDARLDIEGGSRIPAIGLGGEAATLLADLRASWRGVQRLLLAYDGSPLSADFLDTVLSFLDPAIAVTLIDVAEDAIGEEALREARRVVERGLERARELGRAVDFLTAQGSAGQEIVRVAVEGKFDAIFMSLRGEYRRRDTAAFASNTRYVLENAPCRVILGFAPKSIPHAPATAGSGAASSG